MISTTGDVAGVASDGEGVLGEHGREAQGARTASPVEQGKTSSLVIR